MTTIPDPDEYLRLHLYEAAHLNVRGRKKVEWFQSKVNQLLDSGIIEREVLYNKLRILQLEMQEQELDPHSDIVIDVLLDMDGY